MALIHHRGLCDSLLRPSSGSLRERKVRRGRTYDHASIIEWLRLMPLSPFTRMPVSRWMLRTNFQAVDLTAVLRKHWPHLEALCANWGMRLRLSQRSRSISKHRFVTPCWKFWPRGTLAQTCPITSPLSTLGVGADRPGNSARRGRHKFDGLGFALQLPTALHRLSGWQVPFLAGHELIKAIVGRQP